jgi:diguanylate cyclase (GGDEF)-like protein
MPQAIQVVQLWCSLALILAPVVAHAAPAEIAPESPRFTHLSVDDGLSQSSVLQILQDRKGLLWFGTQEGLNRYDGYRFTVHRAREQDGFLRDHDITAMIADEDGDLWVGTSKGLYRYDLDTGRFDGCAAPADRLGIVDLIESGGRIFFAASDGRLWTVDRGDAQRRPRALSGGVFAPLTGSTAIARGKGSAIWVAAQGRLFDVELDANGSDGRLEAVLGVWLGRLEAELIRYRPADGGVDRFPQAPRNTLAILPGRGGEVWIGARAGGLSRLDPASGELITYRHNPEEPASLSSDNVSAIYEDAVGSLWIGSWNGGVNRFDPGAQAFRTFRHRPGAEDSLPADDATGMIEAPDGALWLVSRGGLVMTGDPRRARFRTVAALPGRGRFVGLAWWDGRVLVATSRGLIALDPVSGSEVALDPALQSQRLADQPITAIRSGPEAGWIAIGKDVFHVFRRGASGPVLVKKLALNVTGAVSALSIVGSGRLWVGTDAGEVRRGVWSGADSPAAVQPLELTEAARGSLAAHGLISTILEDRQGRLWLGTRRGLGRLEPTSGEITWLGQQQGLPSTTIAGMAGDADGRLWLSHNRGLTRIDPETGEMIHFGEREGAQGKGYAEGAWTAGASGLMYFAGAGVTAFEPRQVRVSTHHPELVFTALEVLHRPVVPKWLDPHSSLERTIDSQEEVTLGPDATVFSVEMAPLHFVDPPSNRLMYRLDGFDPEWIDADAHNRVATYTNLAPGRYVLRAKAGTKNGLWSQRETTLTIHILPPWWRTRTAVAGWAALGLAAAGLLLTAIRRRARVRQALRERETLRRESLTDPLTGLHNRRFLLTYLQHEIPKVLREYRERGPAAVEWTGDLLLLVVDVDHFKTINDRYSHGVGDRVLSRIGATLAEHVRDSDLTVRWGGDEFLVVTRSFQRSRAFAYAERLRAAVAAEGEAHAAEGGPAYTLSIGFAAFPFVPGQPEALTWEQTLELADHALNFTKRRKRNSYTGLRAGARLDAAGVLAFLAAGRGAPLPEGMELVLPDEGEVDGWR